MAPCSLNTNSFVGRCKIFEIPLVWILGVIGRGNGVTFFIDFGRFNFARVNKLLHKRTGFCASDRLIKLNDL